MWVPAGCGCLLPGPQLGLVHAQDLHELDAVDRVHDLVELALVEHPAERPAVPRAGGVAADERVQVGVERLQDLLLDAVQVGPRLGLEVDDDRHASQPHGQQMNRRADHAPAVEIAADLAEQVLVRRQLLVGELAIGGSDPGKHVDPDRVGGRCRRDADRATNARRRLADEELEVLRRDRAIPGADLHRGTLARRVERLGIDAAVGGPRVGHRGDAGDRAAQHRQRVGRDVPAPPAAVAVAAHPQVGPLRRDRAVLGPAAVGLAHRRPQLELAVGAIEPEVPVVGAGGGERLDLAPLQPAIGAGSLTSRRSPSVSGSTGENRSGSTWPGVPSLVPSYSARSRAACSAATSAPIGLA